MDDYQYHLFSKFNELWNYNKHEWKSQDSNEKYLKYLIDCVECIKPEFVNNILKKIVDNLKEYIKKNN